MTKLIKYQLFNLIGILNAGTFLVLAILLLLPIVSNGANAEDEVSDNTTMRMEIVANPVVSIALDDSVGMEFTPKAAGAFDSKSARLVINTNNISGYRIIMSTEGTTNDLTNIDDAGIIKSISGQVSASAFPNNTWGYNITQNGESLDPYNAIPNTDTEIKNVQHEVMVDQADIYSLNFGAKVSSSIPAGTYSKQVIVSAVANPIMKNNMMHLDYMQEMTNEYCKNTRGTDGSATVTPGNEPSKQLIDIRDGKKYWVSKLADQNCWMTQNLAYDITEERINSGAINPTNTDVSETWGKNSAYPPAPVVNITDKTKPTPIPGEANTQLATYSFNPGEYVLALPRMNSICAATNPSLEACASVGFYDVSDQTKWTPTYDAANDPINAGKIGAEYHAIKCTEGHETIENVNGQPELTTFCTAGEYDPHYLVGSYYQWNTGVAGSVSTATDAPHRASSSVCPKNWRLPDGGGVGDSINTQSGTYYNLLKQYGVTNDLGGSTVNGYQYAMPISPLYFVRSGDIVPHKGNDYLWAIGRSGYYATNTSDGATNQYLLLFHGIVDSDYIHDMYHTNSIRCLAR